MTTKTILNGVKFTVCKAEKTTKDYLDSWKAESNKYRVTVSRNNNSFSCPFYMGKALNNKPTKLDVLHCFLCDDVAYMTFEEFCSNFGYVSNEYDDPQAYKQALETWEGCKRETAFIHKAFTDDELETIREYLQEQGF